MACSPVTRRNATKARAVAADLDYLLDDFGGAEAAREGMQGLLHEVDGLRTGRRGAVGADGDSQASRSAPSCSRARVSSPSEQIEAALQLFVED